MQAVSNHQVTHPNHLVCECKLVSSHKAPIDAGPILDPFNLGPFNLTLVTLKQSKDRWPDKHSITSAEPTWLYRCVDESKITNFSLFSQKISSRMDGIVNKLKIVLYLFAFIGAQFMLSPNLHLGLKTEQCICSSSRQLGKGYDLTIHFTPPK